MEKRTDSKKRALPANKLSTISKKYVPDDQLEDPPARLFRRILHKLEMNPFKWAGYLGRYLEWIVTVKDPEKAKLERQTRTGNIKDTYFHKPSLTFNKFLEGLSILEFEECHIEITVKDIHGNIIRVSDEIKMVSRDRKKMIEESLAAEEAKKK
jgi:hypothetical protein